ncbi:MAG: hypothetical protein GX421_06340 [Caldisericales bacterium]|nr:hypothetical protein [Caldisericales bacterium]
MRKFVISLLFVVFLVSFFPAHAGQGPVIYGTVTKIAGIFGPVTIDTGNMVFDANLRQTDDASGIYLGAEISCRADYDGKIYVVMMPMPFAELPQASWLAEVLKGNRDSKQLLLSSPNGPTSCYFNEKILAGLDFIPGSIIKITARQNFWSGNFIAEQAQLISR